MRNNLYFYFFLFVLVVAICFLVLVPAFAGKFQIHPAIVIGSYEIRWYGIILAAAILVSYFTARSHSWKFGISVADVDDFAFWLVIVGILGARIYYVVFNLDYFLRYPAEIYKIWHGGISIYGGILSGLAFAYFYAKRKAYGFWQLIDLTALSLPLGQAIGRFGNFVNQEAYGSVTNLPWKMYVAADGQFHHPTFLYEAIFDVLIFVVLYKLFGKLKLGNLGLTYLALYSFGRFFIERLRVDSFFLYGFRVDQAVAFLLVVVCGSMVLRRQAA